MGFLLHDVDAGLGATSGELEAGEEENLVLVLGVEPDGLDQD